MYFAHGYKDPVTGVTGLRGRMDSQGDYTANIVKLPNSNREWDPIAAKEENEFVRSMTGMDFDNPENTVKLKNHYDMYIDENGHESGKLTKEGAKENRKMGELNENLFRQRFKYGYRKNGGLLYKSGGKPTIHIKKQNRGKFTEYCGGEVTTDCISKGKSSKNPAIRKRATFAANARKWKH
jgi:hypothetical protein